MPTPFYHLSLAQEILVHPKLPKNIKHLLEEERCSFFFGKTAPDVQSISDQDRASTHFFKLPLGDQPPAWESLLAEHPEFSGPNNLSPAHRAFIAGYLCHLQADVLWIKMIFWPNFAEPKDDWEDLHKRLYSHNVLRAYLDERIIKNLPKGIGSCLDQVEPQGWLPFVEDQYLIKWRNFLSAQLHPNGMSKTSEVFAQRMGVSKEEIDTLIHSEKQMENEIFSHIPRKDLVKYREEILSKNLYLLTHYFK